MSPSPILSVIHTIIISTMLNFNVGNNGDGLKTIRVNRPLLEKHDSLVTIPVATNNVK